MAVLLEEPLDGGWRFPVEDHVDEGVACRPGIGKALAAPGAEEVVELVLQRIERLAQRRAPLLVPVAAILQPQSDRQRSTPCAAPGAVLVDLDFPLGRVKLEELAVVGQPDVRVLGQAIEHVRQRHVAVGVVMAVRFAVGGDVHELGVFAARGRTPERAAPGSARRGRAAARRPPAARRCRRRRRARSTGPTEAGRDKRDEGSMPPPISTHALLADLPPPFRLAGRQDRERDARLGQGLQRRHVHGRLGQPHSLRLAAEPVAEVGDPPEHLRLLVSAAGQRQDHVIVNLRQRVAVPPAPLLAEAVGLDETRQHVRCGFGHPLQQRGAEVEADPGIIVQEVDDPSWPSSSRARVLGA